MRFIGDLPSEQAAIKFSNVLLGLGIEHKLENDSGAWSIWVLAEEEYALAARYLEEFLKDPAARRFESQAREGAVKRRMLEEDLAGTGARDGLLDALPRGLGALTAVLSGSCLAISCAVWAGYEQQVYQELLITRISVAGSTMQWEPSLAVVFQKGEFWRLITPALVHFSGVHLLFNLIWWIDLGSKIEKIQGPARLGALFLTIGVGSNLLQFWLAGPAFCGISGVLYGLLGYLWMKGKFDPESGLAIHPYTLVLMLVLFFLGLGGAFKTLFGISMANGAHSGGLVLGILWGLLTSLPAIRRRRKNQARPD